MKKLMIAMGAAALFSLCATAGETINKVSSVTFENLTVGKFDPTADDNGTAAGKVYWTTAESADDISSTIVKGEETAGNSSQYLHVDAQQTLFRNMDVDDDSAAKTTEIPGNGGVYIKTKVQFTAADEAPTPEDGDKLLVWLRQNEDDATTTLMVTSLDSKGDVVATEVNNISVNTTDWYDLEIRAALTGGEGLRAYPVFTVAINNVLANDGERFTSLVTFGSLKQTISSLGFKGTGAVDDIEFGTYEQEVVAEFTATVSCNGEDGSFGFPDESGDLVTEKSFLVTADTIELYVDAAGNVDAVSCNIDGATKTLDTDETGDFYGLIKVVVPVKDIEADATFAIVLTISETPDDPGEKTYPSYINTEDETAVAKYNTWAESKASSVEDAFVAENAYEEAYLLNVEPTEAAVKAAKEAFKITSITVNEDGTATVVVTATNVNGEAFNGTVEVKGSATVNGDYSLSADSTKARFYKAVLK